MGWELRGQRRYYYRKTRHGSQVASEYIGGGPIAAARAAADALDRQCRKGARTRAAADHAAIEEGDDELADLAAAVAALTRAILLANDYHYHKGQWRRRHGTTE